MKIKNKLNFVLGCLAFLICTSFSFYLFFESITHMSFEPLLLGCLLLIYGIFATAYCITFSLYDQEDLFKISIYEERKNEKKQI